MSHKARSNAQGRIIGNFLSIQMAIGAE